MASGNYEFQSDFAKKHQAKGRDEGLQRVLIALLEARGISLTPEDRERIAACADSAQLDAWIRRAVAISTASELF